MKEYRYEFMIGVMVMVALVSLAVLIVATGDIDYFKKYYDVTVSFERVSGLQPGSPVRMAGVTIGKVKAITLDAQKARVKVLVSILDELVISQQSFVRITSSGIIGENYLDFSLADTSKGVLSKDGTGELSGISDVTIDELKNSVGKFINTIGSDALVNDVKRIIVSTRNTSEETERFARFLNEIKDLHRADISIALDDLRATSANLRSFTTTIDDSARKILGDGKVPGDIRDIADSTKTLVQKVNQTADKLNKLTDSAGNVITSSNEVVQKVKDAVTKVDGRIEQITDNLKSATGNMKNITEDLLAGKKGLAAKILHDEKLAEQMEGIVDNVEAFTDKVEEWSKSPSILFAEYFKGKDIYREQLKAEKEAKKQKKPAVKKGFGPRKSSTKEKTESVPEPAPVPVTAVAPASDPVLVKCPTCGHRLHTPKGTPASASVPQVTPSPKGRK